MKKAFTLIEILVVISILSLLILAGVWASKLQLLKARDGRQKSDLHKIQVALEDYEKDNGCYPDSPFNCGDSDGFRPYIGNFPCNPATDGDYVYRPEPVDCPKWYWIFTNLENENDSVIEKLGCADGCGVTENDAIYNYYVSSPNAPIPAYGDGIPDPTPTPSLPPGSEYYGCFSSHCEPISDPCTPNYRNLSDCLHYCDASKECMP